MGKTVTLLLRQDHEQVPTTAAKLSVTFIHYPLLFQLSHFFRSKHRSRWQKNSWLKGLFPLFFPLWAPPYASMVHPFLNTSKSTSSSIICENALKLFYKLENFFNYPLKHLDLNENWRSPVKPLPRQPSEVGHVYYLHAPNLHPRAASTLRVCFLLYNLWHPSLPLPSHCLHQSIFASVL